MKLYQEFFQYFTQTIHTEGRKRAESNRWIRKKLCKLNVFSEKQCLFGSKQKRGESDEKRDEK